MAYPINETGVVKSIVKAVVKRYPNAWHMKVHGNSMQSAGTPDLLFSIHGYFFAFEVKHQKPAESTEHAYGRASLRQLKKIADIQKSGATAAVVLSAEEVLDIISKNLPAELA